MSSKTTIAVIGAAGLIGKRHVKHILQNPLARLHSIVDPSEEGARLAADLGIPVFLNLETFIVSFSTSKPQAAIIATPSHMHVAQAIQLLKYGIHLLLEKPVCTSVESGLELLKASATVGAGTILSGYHRRFNPYIIALKNMLGSGKLGRIVAVQGIWAAHKPSKYFTEAAWRTQNGAGGTLLTNMSHEIDIFRYLFGEVSRVFLEIAPNLRGYDVDETGAAILRFASGIVGTFVFSDTSLSPYSFEAATGENPTLVPRSGENVYRVLGVKGSVEFPALKRFYYDGTGEGDWTHKLAIDEETAPENNPSQFTYSYENAPFTKRLDHWLEVISNGATPNCTLRDGIMATVVLEALRESGRTGLPVNVKLEDR